MSKRNHINSEFSNRVRDAIANDDADALRDVFTGDHHTEMKISGKKRAVFFAVRRADPVTFDTLINLGADVNIPPVGVNNPLFASATAGDTRAVKRLLAAGADAAETRNRGSKKEDLLVHEVARAGYAHILELVLDAGGWQVLGARAGSGRTPLNAAKQALATRAALTPANREAMEQCIALIEHTMSLPRLDFAQGFSKADLFTVPEGASHAPLQHPETWQRLEEVNAMLEQNGESLTKADLLAPNGAGTPWLERGVAAYGLKQALAVLNQNGESLGRAELVGANGQPTPLMQLIQDRRQLGGIFTPENCKHWKRDEFNAVLGVMSDYEREVCVPNMHQLRAVAQSYRNRERMANDRALG